MANGSEPREILLDPMIAGSRLEERGWLRHAALRKAQKSARRTRKKKPIASRSVSETLKKKPIASRSVSETLKKYRSLRDRYSEAAQFHSEAQKLKA